jgi:hypothetical protein
LSYTPKAGRFFIADKSEKRKWMITTVPFKNVPMLYPPSGVNHSLAREFSEKKH